MGGIVKQRLGLPPVAGVQPPETRHPQRRRKLSIPIFASLDKECNKPVYNQSFLHQEDEPWQTVRKRRRASAPSYGRKTWGSNGYTFQADQVLRDSWSPGFGNLVHSGGPDYFYDLAGISQPWGVGQMGQYLPMAEEKFWNQPMKLWKWNCLGPIMVSQGETSTQIEYLSHLGHDANRESEWGACGVTRPKPATNLVTHNRFELLAEEPEANTSSLPAASSQVGAQGPSACETVQQSNASPHRPKKQSQQKRKTAKRTPSDPAADQTVHPELRHWQELQQLLGQDVQLPMIAQEAQLVAWAEKYESAIPEGTLGRWTIEHMLTLLARGEDDTPAVPKEPTGMVELKILQANITSYRTEIRRWVTDRPAQVACLQETHIIPAKDQEVKASWSTLAKQVSTVPAAVTQSEARQGSQGGLMMVAANHINLRQLASWESAKVSS